MARLGIVIARPGETSFAELQELAREAESAGVEAVFSPEFMNDALSNCHVMAQATARIKVGTWIANIYLRHPALCAQTAVAIDDTSKGRLILGLGVSHRPLVEDIYKEKMDRPRDHGTGAQVSFRGKRINGMARRTDNRLKAPLC